MTLKPAVKTEPKRQMARRGKKFQYGCVTRQVTPAAVGGGGGEVQSVYNEVAAAHGLVGLSDEQPKSGYTCRATGVEEDPMARRWGGFNSD